MPTGLMMLLMGIPVRVDFAISVDADVVEDVMSQWQDVRLDRLPEPQLRALVAPGRELRARIADVDLLIPAEPRDSLGERMASQITLALLERMKGKALLLHAGAVALDDGRVIGFVGPSGRGKTTAMSVLARTFRYVTDETLVIRPDLSVVSYPKPLLIGHRPAVKTAHSASSLGLRLTDSASDLRLAALVLLDRREGAPVPGVASVDPVEAVVDLVGESSYLSALDTPLRTILDLLTETGGVRRVTYSEAESLPDAIDDIVACIAESPVQRCVGDQMAEDIPSRSGWHRSPYVDARAVGERLMVMHGRKVTVLDGIGPAVWAAAAGASDETLTQAVLREHPEPPPGVDPALAVASVAAELESAGLLGQR